MRPGFAAAVSRHPVPSEATGEVLGEVLEHVGADVDLALLFVTPHHAGALEDIVGAVRRLLRPATLLGCSAVSVVGNSAEIEDAPAVTLWAGRFGAVVPITGTLPADLPFEPKALILLADPYSFPAEELFAELALRWPGLPVVGGNASAAAGPGGNRLVLDEHITTQGAVGVFLGPGLDVDVVVSQGCKPIGQPLVVTKGEGQIVQELGGRPPLERLEELARDELAEEDVATINRGGLHVGRAVDEHLEAFGPGDFLIRNVMGANREQGWVAVGDMVEVGATLQFHLRDAASAHDDLVSRLHADPVYDAALLFTCNGRGRRFFGEADHDATLVSDAVVRDRPPPVTGFFAAGEFGPVGGRNFVHGFTASVALLRCSTSG